MMRYLFKHKLRSTIAKTLFSDEHDENKAEPELPFFHLSTIIAATDNFSLDNKLGEGGFGSVHKVKFRLDENKQYDIK